MTDSKIKTLFIELNPTDDWWEPLSYIIDWKEAILSCPSLQVEQCNIVDTDSYRKTMNHLPEFEFIIISHSATGDSMDILLETSSWFHSREAKLAVFIGNEYSLMDQKIRFIQQTGAELICSQLPLETARYLYRECEGSRIIEMPHGLNPKLYHVMDEIKKRVDICFVGDVYHPWIGDRERTEVIDYFLKHGEEKGITCDIRTRRIGRERWAKLLNASYGIIGAESGTFYLNDRGALMEKARLYFQQHPDTDYETMFNLFFKNIQNPISGKAISSRHFEPIGTKTCQILMEGNYNGILHADKHYIAIKKDFSNMDDVIRRFKDETYRRGMVDQTFDYVMSQHTYSRRIQKLARAVSDTGFIQETHAI